MLHPGWRRCSSGEDSRYSPSPRRAEASAAFFTPGLGAVGSVATGRQDARTLRRDIHGVTFDIVAIGCQLGQDLRGVLAETGRRTTERGG